MGDALLTSVDVAGRGATRRTFDLAVALPATILLALPFALVAAAVRLTSPGPAFFLQPRVGRGGRVFQLVKFRTMREASAGGLVTAAGDRRITAIGRLLRRTKIDELPQLFNVLRGDMGLIGPRPEVERFVALYDERERTVLAACPGFASMAQLVYPHEAESLTRVPPAAREEAYVRFFLHKKVAVDLAYERRRTLGTDLGLMIEVGLLVAGVRPRVDLSTDRDMEVAGFVARRSVRRRAMSGPSAVEARSGDDRDNPDFAPARAPRILIVTALFTPSRLIGARRPERMARELKARGWDVTVLTLQPRFMAPFDRGLRDPDGVEVVRTTMVRPVERARRLASRARRFVARRFGPRATSPDRSSDAPAEPTQQRGGSWLTWLKQTVDTWARHAEFPDSWTGWRPFAARSLGRSSFDVVLATIPPLTPAVIARRIARSSGAALVLDYRDPWLESPSRAAEKTAGSGRLYRRWEALENTLLGDSALAIGTTPTICRILERRGAGAVAFLPNSFDAPLRADREAGGRGGSVLYLGSLNVGRRLDPVVQALTKLESGQAAQAVRLSYAGPDPQLAREQAERSGGADRLEILGNMSHREAVSLLEYALVGVVIVSSGFEHAIPGKVYEFVAAGCPILLIGDLESDAATMVRDHGLGFAHGVDDVDGIARSLSALLRGVRPVPKNLEHLSTQYVADRLDQALRARLRR